MSSPDPWDDDQPLFDMGYGPPETWETAAKIAILNLARECKPFTAEDVEAIVGLPSGRVGRDRNNAVGQLMRQARARRKIRLIGETYAKRPTSKASKIGLWIGADCG